MSTELGNGGSLPSGSTTPINIPTSEAPQPELKLDSKIQMLSDQGEAGAVDTFKLKASSFDATPGFLDAKITSQFSIDNFKLKLIGFGLLTTSDLTEGTNLYYTQARFNSDLATKTTDNIAEGSTNKYYSSLLFDSDLATKSTDDLTEGLNLYFTNARAISALSSHTGDTSIHFSDLSSFTTDDLSEGVVNKYLSASQSNEISANTAAKHTHSNKSLLDSYNQSNIAISNAISLAHSHSNKAILDGTQESFTTALKDQYDSYVSGSIASVSAPLDLTSGVLSHNLADGNKHVPSNSSAAQYAILASGASAGIYSWVELETIIANSDVFEASPSSSTTKGVQSTYINTHVSNGTTNVKHVTDTNLTYINTTIPAHIANGLIHVPSFTPVTDRGKFLYINTSDALAWTTSATNIQTAGESYVSAAGDTITMSKITLAQTELIAGSNITFSTNTISATWRGIDTSPVNGENSDSISSGWAYTHSNSTGLGNHVPTGGTSGQYLDGDGTWKDFSAASGGIYKIILSAGGPTGNIDTRLVGATFPSGWSGAKDTVTTDLVITHTAAKQPMEVKIWSNDGSDKTLLIGSAAYSTIVSNSGNTEITVQSLATIDTEIIIYIQFE